MESLKLRLLLRKREVLIMRKHALGAIPSPIDVRDYRIACASNVEFPAEFELEMPKVKNQGSVGSCVAHAISIVVEYFSRLQGDESKEMSVGYIYGNRTNTSHKDSGMIVRSALEVTCEYGDVIKTSFPYNEEIPEIIEKFEAKAISLFPKGYPHRFSSYYKCGNASEIKTALMKKTPVIMAMDWYEDIEVVDGVMQTNYQVPCGGHCMVIYGWNEHGWKIQNSWGTSWGNKGKAILPYDIPMRETWGVVDEISENQTKLRIAELEKANIELQNKINNIGDDEQLILAQEEIRKLQEEIKNLKSELTELKKPYNSKIGQFFAKIANGFMRLF